MGDERTFDARTASVAAQGGGAIDADCVSCCTMRLPTYRIVVRSFHPNRIFEETDHLPGWVLGGPWTGDNRGFSLDTDPKTTSRVMHSYVANTAQMPRWFQTIRPTAASDTSHGWSGEGITGTYPQDALRWFKLIQTSPYGRLYEFNGPQAHPDARVNTAGFVLISQKIPEAKIVRSDLLLDQPCRKAATIVTHHFGVNVAVPAPAATAGAAVPDLDVFAKISLDVNRTTHTLDVEAIIFGDGFPNCEAFLEDESGTRVFLGVSRRRGYPIASLSQLASFQKPSTLSGVQTNLMFKSQLRFALNELGALLRFSSGLSIKDWNHRFIQLNPNSTEIPTEFKEQ